MHQPTPTSADLDAVRAALAGATRLVVLTGAGISAESGVPVFRGPGGLWRGFRPEDLATPEAFEADPARVWAWYRWRRSAIAAAVPNAGHLAIASLEERVPDFVLLTQNVDGLHQRSGSRRVLELHGSIWQTVCERRCGVAIDESTPCPSAAGEGVNLSDDVPRCRCGARLRPGVVWFGESLDEDVVQAAHRAAETADLMLVIGTSGLVFPAAGLPLVTRQRGGRVVEINPSDTPLTPRATWVLRGSAGEICPALLTTELT